MECNRSIPTSERFSLGPSWQINAAWAGGVIKGMASLKTWRDVKSDGAIMQLMRTSCALLARAEGRVF